LIPMEAMKLSEIKPNPNNPRIIKDDKYHKLVQSIKEFPEMLEKRPIVVNQDMVVLGGNMRLRACKEAGLKDVPVMVADWTEEQQRQFIIKDNVGFGEWDWDMIANEWDAEEVEGWGLDIPVFEDFSDKNQELDVNGFEDEMIIKLKYSEDDYEQVREQLSKISATPEQAVWKLLGNE
jgi:ParB-like chromosome segregation protein Spo0J